MSATLPDTTVISYDHDPMGRRIAKRINGTITEKYMWQDATTLLAVYDSSDNLLMRFEYADGRMPEAMTAEGQVYYLTYDQVGSLRVVTNNTGVEVKRVEYDSFGNILSDSNLGFDVRFGFAGGLHDRDTGLVRFGSRDYDPAVARWTAKDPIDFAGGDLNLLAYVGQDPINFVDPNGLYSWNAEPPRTVPVTGATANQLDCVERCLKRPDDNVGDDGLLCTGGQEQTGHSANSHHYSNNAVDIAGPAFNNYTTNEVEICGEQCQFGAGFFEDEAGVNSDHWHLQNDPGNGVPALTPVYD